MSDKVLVTGGCGFIGSHLVDSLVACGKEVVVLDNLSRASASPSLSKVNLVIGDVEDATTVQEVIEGMDIGIVFHLAAQSRVIEAENKVQRTIATNVLGTVNVLQAAYRHGVQRVVFTSSREVYGEGSHVHVTNEAYRLQPKSQYGVSKAAAELYCNLFQKQGMDVTILRLSNVYGPRDHGRVIPTFISRALAGDPLVLNRGGQIIDFVYVSTVVECLKQAAYRRLHNHGPVNIASGIGHSIRSVAEHVIKLTGSKSEVLVSKDYQWSAIETECFVADTRKMFLEFRVRSPSSVWLNLVESCAGPSS